MKHKINPLKKPRIRAQADINKDNSQITIHISLGPIKHLINPAKKLFSIITRPK